MTEEIKEFLDEIYTPNINGDDLVTTLEVFAQVELSENDTLFKINKNKYPKLNEYNILKQLSTKNSCEEYVIFGMNELKTIADYAYNPTKWTPESHLELRLQDDNTLESETIQKEIKNLNKDLEEQLKTIINNYEKISNSVEEYLKNGKGVSNV